MANNFIEEMQEWRILVGTTILSFGEIELITYKCLAHIPKDKIHKSLSSLPFTKRIDLIIEILESRKINDTEFNDFINNLKSARKLAKYRNLLAHNPLAVDVYMDKVTGDIEVEQLISSIKNENKVISLGKLKEIALEAELLSSKLYQSLNRVLDN